MLQGKKTYIVMAVTIALALAEGFFGVDIPGFELGDNWLATILGASGLSALRAGMTTEAAKL